MRHLQAEGRPHAIFGAIGMALHGVDRTTSDVDLLITYDALDRELWKSLRGVIVDVRMGDDDDNLLGCVKCAPSASMPVDLVVPRGRWPRRALERTTMQADIGGVVVPVLELADIVLAKVHAGSHGDTRDILTIFEHRPELRDAIIAHVDAESAYMYGPAKRDWPRIRAIITR